MLQISIFKTVFFAIFLSFATNASETPCFECRPDPLIPKSVYATLSNFARAHPPRTNQIPPNSDFPPCTNPNEGFNTKALSLFFRDAEVSESNSLIIVKDGCTAFENHYAGDFQEVFSVQSVSKSVASIAIGSLINAGLLTTLDYKIANIFPSLQNDPDKKQITIRHLLTHTSGFGDWDSAGSGNDPLEAALNSKLKAKPGQQFIYSSMASFLLGATIRNLSNGPADQFIQGRIFQPIGVSSAKWLKDPSGNIDTGGGLFMNSRQMLNLGELMWRGGQWGGQNIVSLNWVRDSVTSSQSLYPPYGFLWWLYSPGLTAQTYKVFSAVGYQGQYIAVDPKNHLIVVRTHRIEETTDLERLKKIMWIDFPDRISGLVAP